MNITQVPSTNFGYPRGTHGQNKPEALFWHITASRPTDPPLIGLDSHFTNPIAYASTQLGIQEEAVHQYVDFRDACWGQGYMDRPDLSNSIVKNWWNNNTNPNLRSIGVEVVRQPGPVEVPHGTHLVNEDTWRTMKEVGRFIAEEVSSIGFVVVRWIGHWQVDGVNRQRDPKNVYWPTDILEEILEDIAKEERVYRLYHTWGPAKAWLVEYSANGLFPNWKRWVTTQAGLKILKDSYGDPKNIGMDQMDRIPSIGTIVE